MKLRYLLLSLFSFGIDTKATSYVPCSSLKEGDVTIYIHGTLFPTIAKLLGKNVTRRGLYRYTAVEQEYLAQSLHNADPEQFPATSFHKFFWCGSLGSYERKRAANDLFQYLKNHKGKITIIAHSHGCNVALYLAELAQKKFSIERLILLAPPVQEETKELVHSTVFKNVYSFYSAGDLVQTMDPQILHTKTFSTLSFSERAYKSGENVIQTRVLIDYKNPGHNDFIRKKFFKRIPPLLKLLDENPSHQAIINIPPYPLPAHVVDSPENLLGTFSSKLL